MIQGRELLVRALAENRRPTANTPTLQCSLLEHDARGRVCLGSMRVPDETGVASLTSWKNAYFASEFTHPSGAVGVRIHPGGFFGLWSSLAGKKHRVSREVSSP
jgi:PRTRC genetic system protein B